MASSPARTFAATQLRPFNSALEMQMKKIEIKQALLYVLIMLLFQAVVPVSISKFIIINPE